MEKRSFVLGLGIGIVFSVIITWIIYGISESGSLTDEEVEQKARELGMEYSSEGDIIQEETEMLSEAVSYAPAVYEAETNEPVSYNNEEDITVSDTEAPNTNANAKINKNKRENNRENERPKGKLTEAEKNTEAAVAESVFTNINDATAQPVENTANAVENAQNEQESDYIDITISSGINAKGVSNVLAQKGIVENASDYEKYLIDNGKTKSIRSGNYKIPKDVSYDDLTNIIVNRNR